MKKTLMALAIPAALAAGSASAAINVYNSNGIIVDMGGSAEIQQFKSNAEDQDATLRIEDGDFFVNTTVNVAPGFNVVSGIGFAFETSTDNPNLQSNSANVTSDELFVGMQSNFGTITFGRQYTLGDDAGNTKDYELASVGSITFGDTQSSRVIKWFYDNGGPFYAAANAILDANSSDKTTEAYGYEGMLGVRFAGFDSRVFYYNGQNMVGSFRPSGELFSSFLQDINGFNYEIDYAYDVFDVSAGIGYVTFEPNAVTTEINGENKVLTWQIAAGYQADQRTYFAAGFSWLDTDASGIYYKEKGYSLYTNVTYALHTNAKMYAEIGISDLEKTDSAGVTTESNVQDLGYVLGMEVTF